VLDELGDALKKAEDTHARKLKMEADQELCILKVRAQEAEVCLGEALVALATKPQLEQLLEDERTTAVAQELLTQLRDLYKCHPAYFTPDIMAEIKEAKFVSGMMTQDEVTAYRKDQENERITAAHCKRLSTLGKVSKGVRIGTAKHRATHCYSCQHSLDSNINLVCVACGWIICICGACGCGYVQH
jgi:hypothetical protein